MLIWLGKQYLGQADKTEESGEYKIIVERRSLGTEMVLRREHDSRMLGVERYWTGMNSWMMNE